MFGSGTVSGHHRTGYHLADALIAEMNRPLPELVRLAPEDAAAAIRTAVAGVDHDR
jgi:hypothetical protein